MIMKKINVIIALSLILGCSACSDILDKGP